MAKQVQRVCEKDDLLALLESSSEPPGDGFMSRHEWCDYLGLALQRVAPMLMEMNRIGCLETKQRTIKNIANRVSHVPVYRIDTVKLRKSRGKK